VALFRPEDEARVRELLEEQLLRPVELLVAHGPEETPLPGARDIDFAAETERVARGLAELSASLAVRVEEEPPGFERYPAVAVLPEGADAGVRYYGLPYGYELGSLIGAILEAGREESTLRPETLERVGGLDRDVAIDVFVTPT
jgi:alkyl hydroperoxide reductase subunit AhpF